MNTMRPAVEKPLVMRLNGDVLEFFRISDYLGYHVSFIKKLELRTDKKGAHFLEHQSGLLLQLSRHFGR